MKVQVFPQGIYSEIKTKTKIGHVIVFLYIDFPFLCQSGPGLQITTSVNTVMCTFVTKKNTGGYTAELQGSDLYLDVH